MYNTNCKKMFEVAEKYVKAAKEKHVEIEHHLKTSIYRNYALILSPLSWENAQHTIKKICFESNTAEDALQAILKLDFGNFAQVLQVSISDLQKRAQCGALFVGDMVLLPYTDFSNGINTLIPFKVCRTKYGNADRCTALLDCAFTLDLVKFSTSENNNYATSTIRKCLVTLENCFDPELVGIIKSHNVKYVDTSIYEYMTVTDKFWLLDLDEVLTFYKTMDDRRKFMVYGNAVGSADCWLMRSDCTNVSNIAYHVDKDGSVKYDVLYSVCGCSPAFIIG